MQLLPDKEKDEKQRKERVIEPNMSGENNSTRMSVKSPIIFCDFLYNLPLLTRGRRRFSSMNRSYR